MNIFFKVSGAWIGTTLKMHVAPVHAIQGLLRRKNGVFGYFGGYGVWGIFGSKMTFLGAWRGSGAAQSLGE